MPTTRTRPSPLLLPHLNHLQSPLHPLLSITTGAPHPAFPATLLHYHLLTEAQLDELAHYYHQRTPSGFSLLYPEPVIGRWFARNTSAASTSSTTNSNSNQNADNEMDILAHFGLTRDSTGEEEARAGIEEKRRRFGRFVGLRGCESPTAEGEIAQWGEAEMERWVRARVEAGMEREREREEVRRKGVFRGL
ncbi:hypothetical protein MMC30_000282 [Trapelia coarctata]|nr:hypothetical protein [Trapelia coarctata]